MGKGDRRTRRGKIFRGTFGVCRPQKRTKNVAKSEKVYSNQYRKRRNKRLVSIKDLYREC